MLRNKSFFRAYMLQNSHIFNKFQFYKFITIKVFKHLKPLLKLIIRHVQTIFLKCLTLKQAIVLGKTKK